MAATAAPMQPQTLPVPVGNDDQARRAMRARLRDRLAEITNKLEQEATSRIGKRYHIEQRWIRDLEQYHGKYDPDTERKLKRSKRSELFVNLTRPKTNAMAARLMDLLFPTDDRNWGIKPTPVPSLTRSAEAAIEQARQMKAQAEQAQQMAQMAPGDPQAAMMAQAAGQAAQEAEDYAETLRQQIAEAKKRAEGMADVMEDHLKESSYQAAMRDVIEDACKLGTGVCKGPITGDRVRRKWVQEGGQYVLREDAGEKAAFRWVDMWNFFPDMNARNIQEGKGVFERHLLNAKGVRKLASLPGFDAEAIRALIKATPKASAPSYLSDLRRLPGDHQQIDDTMFHVWEYTGPLEAEDIKTLALATMDMDTYAELDEVDPLAELQAVVWFSQGEILKFAIYPMDSGETLYSVFNLDKDESSIFGYGVPYMIRHPQRMLNSAARMMMDNSGLSVGPQVVINRKMIEPMDGDWVLTPTKLWDLKEGVPKDAQPFQVFGIPSMQAELGAIMAMAQQQIDTETQLPQIAQGEQGSGVTKTAQGMAILMNSANTVFRRIVKNFDDDVTVPNIRRLYDWVMQFSDNDEIKGDYEVDARGSSVLLAREMQSQNLMVMALQFGAHPVYGPMMRQRDMLKKVFQAHMIPVDEVVLTQEEIDAIVAASQAQAEQQQQAGPQGEDPQIKMAEMQLKERELEAKIAIAEMEAANRMQIEQLRRETALIQLAERANIEVDKLREMLADKQAERASKERMFAAEVAMTERTGNSAGGSV